MMLAYILKNTDFLSGKSIIVYRPCANLLEALNKMVEHWNDISFKFDITKSVTFSDNEITLQPPFNKLTFSDVNYFKNKFGEDFSKYIPVEDDHLFDETKWTYILCNANESKTYRLQILKDKLNDNLRKSNKLYSDLEETRKAQISLMEEIKALEK